MNPIFVPMFAIAIFTASPHSGAKDNVEQETGHCRNQKVGGKVTMSEAKKGSPSQCIAVDLSGTRDTDAAMENLRALPQLPKPWFAGTWSYGRRAEVPPGVIATP